MSSRTTSPIPDHSAGPVPSRAAVVHTLPATDRPGAHPLLDLLERTGGLPLVAAATIGTAGLAAIARSLT